ncbi:MAG TPA: hypothetical protein DF698_07310 [Candidatus Atribacteria bacterium]|nr:hypothetical protein [Candidatus Atribacteria bacterium]
MNNQDSERLNAIFNYAQEFLIAMCPRNISLEKYLENKKNIGSLDEIYKRMIVTLVNRNMLPGVIQFDKRQEKFKELLLDYDANLISSTYDEKSLYEIFKQNFEINNSDSPKNLWWQFSKFIISASKFLCNFKTAKEFDNFVKTFSENKFTRAALPMLLNKEVHGLRFALACDFLKEIGYIDYPKPDVHLMDIFSSLDICNRDEYEVFKAIIRMAKACNKSAYYIDKTIWLICSGNFYIDKIKISGRKKEFIESCKKNIK